MLSNLGDVGAGHVLGRYELLMPIATGGMATVWAARMKGTRGFQKIVAIKTILPHLSEDPLFEQMFLDEASLASRIRHPNVAQILDLGEQAGVLFLVMDWVDGEPLSVVLKTASRNTGSIPLPITLRIVSQACAGMHAAHELRDEAGKPLGLVHRDASPQNLLITFDGVVKLVDFGIAKATARAGAETNAGQIKGKAAYMAPEQVRGGELDRRTDVFALGTILYLMTTGKHPFRGDNDGETLHNIASERSAVPPSKIVKQYPSSLEAVVMRALAKTPARRFASAHELQRALDTALPERLTTDVEVAAFMEHLLGERHERRNQALKAALSLADERTQGRMPVPTPPPSDAPSHSGFTPSSNVSSLLPPRELGAADSGEGGSDPSRVMPSVGFTTTGATRRTTPLHREWWSDGRHLALAAAGLAVVVGLCFLTASRWRARSAPSPARPLSSGLAAEAPEVIASVEPEPPSSVAPRDLEPAPETPAKTRDAEAVRNKAAARTSPRSQPSKPVAPSASATSKPAPSGTAFVPPVQNPGF